MGWWWAEGRGQRAEGSVRESAMRNTAKQETVYSASASHFFL